jgi:hypothetical protein
LSCPAKIDFIKIWRWTGKMLASYFVKNKVKSKNNTISTSQDGMEGKISSSQSFSFAFPVDERGTTVKPTASSLPEERIRQQLPQTATQRRRARRKKTSNAKLHGSSAHESLEEAESITVSECGADANQVERRIRDSHSEESMDILVLKSVQDPSKTLNIDGSPSLPSSTRQLRKIAAERQKKKQHGKLGGKMNPKEIARFEKQPKSTPSKIVQRCICFNSTAKGSAMVNKSSLLLHSCQKQQQRQDEAQQPSSPFTFGFDIRI